MVESKKVEIARVIKSANSINQQFESNNSFDEGLLTSVKLAKEIFGNISYVGLEEGKTQIKLSIPLVRSRDQA